MTGPRRAGPHHSLRRSAPLRLLLAASDDGALRACVEALQIDADVHHLVGGDLAHPLQQSFDCAILDGRLAAVRDGDLLKTLGRSDAGMPILLLHDGTANSHGADRRIHSLPLADLDPPRLGLALLRTLDNGRGPTAAKTRSEEACDPLTRLPSRPQFVERLDRSIATSLQDQRPLALLLIDLNDFNSVNQTLGYTAGDRLLEEVAARLIAMSPALDILGRVGDDEFGALLDIGAGTASALTTANQMLDAVSRPFIIDEHRFTIGAAIGVALHPTHGHTADALLRCAESALRAAKRDAVGFAVYDGEENRNEGRQLALAHDLREAISTNQLTLQYQPKVCLATGRICGIEALVRWRHPRQGLLYPDVFIPVAEQVGAIDSLTRWVMNAALSQNQRWRQSGYDLSVSVNLSALSLHNQDLPVTVGTLLRRWDVPAERLVLEITESAIISHVMRATETLRRLHALGVHISIDDFGTGYTSLANLRRLPVTELKVDKSFVMNMRQENDDAVIVRTIIELGRSLGLQVVAEGVEDAETLQQLTDLGCDVVQGYYMSRPLDPLAIEHWLIESPWGMKRQAPSGGREGQRRTTPAVATVHKS